MGEDVGSFGRFNGLHAIVQPKSAVLQVANRGTASTSSATCALLINASHPDFCLELPHCVLARDLDYWSVGLLEHWNVGFLERWIFGTLDFAILRWLSAVEVGGILTHPTSMASTALSHQPLDNFAGV